MKLPRKTKAMESQSVAKPRGRPRKYRRKEDKTITVDQKSVSDAKKLIPIVLIGRYILKEFPKGSVLLGKVVSYSSGLYRVTYEDDSYDGLNSSEIRRLLLDDSYFDDDLTQRKIKLDESILAKIAIVSEKNSSKFSDDLLIENEEEQDVTDVDSFSDSKDSCSDAETPLPLPLPLPPSSGTIGVPEKYVSHLFAVYTFLRSFSTRLFLSPFTLDEFVGALNCRVSNTLVDAIHVSLMRALRRHLENLSAAGSRIASKCLR